MYVCMYHILIYFINFEMSTYRKSDSSLMIHLLTNNPNQNLSTNNSKRNSSSEPDIVFAICGSLFGAADAREEIFKSLPHLFRYDDWVRQTDIYHDIEDDDNNSSV